MSHWDMLFAFDALFGTSVELWLGSFCALSLAWIVQCISYLQIMQTIVILSCFAFSCANLNTVLENWCRVWISAAWRPVSMFGEWSFQCLYTSQRDMTVCQIYACRRPENGELWNYESVSSQITQVTNLIILHVRLLSRVTPKLVSDVLINSQHTIEDSRLVRLTVFMPPLEPKTTTCDCVTLRVSRLLENHSAP